MSLLAWLLARLRWPQHKPSAPTAVPSASPAAPPPVGNFFTPLGAATKSAKPTPRPPLTEVERQARQLERQKKAARWLAVGLTWENTKMLTPEMHRLVIARNFLRDDEAKVLANGWGAELLRVQMEAQELEATGSYFELLDGVVTLAVLELPTLPQHVLNSPPVGEWPVD